MPRTRHKFHIGWLWLVPLTLLFLFRWWGPGLPISPRGESVPQLSYLWMLRRLWASGDALRGWNPLILGGEPTATARVYHLHLTLAAISWLTSLAPEWVLKITHGLTAFLAALGAYMYARHLGRTSGAAVVAGLAFALFPARILLTAESLFVTCVWAGLPWVFWAYERAQDHCSEHGASSLKHRMGSPAINWGLALTWIALTGPQWFLLLLSPLALYILLREGISWVQERLQAGSAAFAPHLRALGLDMLIAGSVVIGLSLFYYLPVLVEQDQLWSSHYVRVYPGVSRWSVSWPLLLRILLRRWAPTFQPYGWDLARVFPNIAWYLGLALCALALAGLTWRREWRRHVPLLGMLLASLLLVAGPTIPHNPAYAIVRRIPYISDSVRNAFRYLWPASFCLAALAAAGVDRLSSLIPGVMGHWAIPALAAVLIQADFWPLTQAYQTVDHYMSTNEIAAHRWLDAVEQPGRYWVPFQLARPGEHYADTSYGVRYNGRPSINDNEYHSPAAPDRATLLFRLGLRGQAERAEGFTPSAQAILDLSATRYVLLHLWPEQYEKTLERLLASG
ncbi:MAG: hypothetical protein H5T69_14170, partial [Chloroflexi bacterium]|nr:hypothetical protein [Chloroflexota bacterium]